MQFFSQSWLTMINTDRCTQDLPLQLKTYNTYDGMLKEWPYIANLMPVWVFYYVCMLWIFGVHLIFFSKWAVFVTYFSLLPNKWQKSKLCYKWQSVKSMHLYQSRKCRWVSLRSETMRNKGPIMWAHGDINVQIKMHAFTT